MPDVAVAQAALLGRALVVAFQYLWVAKKIGGVAGMNSLVVLMVIQVFAITFAHCLVAPGSSFHYNHLCRQYIQITTYSVCMRLFGKPGKMCPTAVKKGERCACISDTAWKTSAILLQSQVLRCNIF